MGSCIGLDCCFLALLCSACLRPMSFGLLLRSLESHNLGLVTEQRRTYSVRGSLRPSWAGQAGVWGTHVGKDRIVARDCGLPSLGLNSSSSNPASGN